MRVESKGKKNEFNRMLQNVKVLRFIKNYKEFCPRLFGNCKGNEIMDKEKKKARLSFNVCFP